MGRLFKAFVFKLTKDVTFKVTLIIGAAVAIFTTLLYLVLNNALNDALKEMYGEGMDASNIKILSGQGMLLSSFSPVQNYGIAIPVTIIVFTTLEFSQGTIRNKIIAGHSKFKIYASLYINGLIYALLLLFTYVGVCTAFGSIFGGFDANGFAYIGTSGAMVSAAYIIKFVILAIVTYVSLVSFTIMIVTLFRSVGPCIPIVLILLFGCYFVPAISNAITSSFMIVDDESTKGVAEIFKLIDGTLKVVDPLYGISVVQTDSNALSETNPYPIATMDNLTFIGGLISNIFYAGLFFLAGSLVFRKRDIK